MKEYKENKFTRPLNKSRISYWIFAVYGLLSIFFFFLPYLYTENSQHVVWISGFEMIKLMEDSTPSLHYGVVLLLACYILGIILLPIGIMGMFSEERNLKTVFVFGSLLTLIKTGCEIAGIIMLNQCQDMNLFLAYGSFITVILSGLVLVMQTLLYGAGKSKRKN